MVSGSLLFVSLPSAQSLINLLTIVNHYDCNFFICVVNLVNYPVIPDPHFVCADCGQLFGTCNSWIFFQLAETVNDIIVDLYRQTVKLFDSRFCEKDPKGHHFSVERRKR